MSETLQAYFEVAQAPLFFACLVLFWLAERAFPKRRPGRSQWPRWRTNFSLTAIAILTLPLMPLSMIGAAFWAESQSFGLLRMWGELPLWVVVVATLLGRSFVSFFTHWLNHVVPLLWRIHRVHHLDTELDVSTTVRFHPLEMPVGALIGAPMVLLLGLDLPTLMIYELLDIVVTLFTHANVRVAPWLDRWLRYCVVTPSLHTVHHSSLREETDCNFGAVFPWWDLLFRTYRTRTQQPVESMQLGLTELREPQANQLGYLLAAPFIPKSAASPGASLVS